LKTEIIILPRISFLVLFKLNTNEGYFGEKWKVEVEEKKKRYKKFYLLASVIESFSRK